MRPLAAVRCSTAGLLIDSQHHCGRAPSLRYVAAGLLIHSQHHCGLVLYGVGPTAFKSWANASFLSSTGFSFLLFLLCLRT